MATKEVNSYHVEEFPHIDEADRKDCTRLYLAALKGSWESVEKMSKIQREINITKETTLHIAAGANKEEFVKQLLIKMKDDKLEALNTKGNTALCYAAATGNVNIAKLMLNQNKDLANVGSVKPLFMAALLGHTEMVKFLSPKTKITKWDITEQVELFVTYASVGMYEQALEMVKADSSLAFKKNNQGKTALHVLAPKPSAFDSGSQPGILRRCINSWRTVKQDQNSKQTEAHQLVKKICAHAYKDDVENLTVNEDISEILFVAAKVGNVEFLVELIRTNVDLIWEMDEQKRTIFHIAVEERHKSIFNIMVNDIGSIKGILLDSKTEDGNNLLHLAAKLAPEHKLNAISGAALQMQQELLWFEEVQKVVRPSFKEMKNKEEQTPDVLFAKQHEGLRKDGEKWMRKAATSSMIIATLIGGIMFIGQLIFSGQPADGSDLPIVPALCSSHVNVYYTSMQWLVQCN
uniref:Uncharacterized protein n=1 Tax=Fagus sylvatica TaxID=28930 RepID=A0A2N9GYH1_FAGSY